MPAQGGLSADRQTGGAGQGAGAGGGTGRVSDSGEYHQTGSVWYLTQTKLPRPAPLSVYGLRAVVVERHAKGLLDKLPERREFVELHGLDPEIARGVERVVTEVWKKVEKRRVWRPSDAYRFQADHQAEDGGRGDAGDALGLAEVLRPELG